MSLGGVSGVRLVSNTVEFLDADGDAGLRMAPPYLKDANGDVHDAEVAHRGLLGLDGTRARRGLTR